MTVKENHTILSRATIRAIVITALVAVAAVFSTQNAGVAFGSCPYTPSPGDQADLWLDMNGEDTYFTDAEWPGLEVKTFSLKGPFRGEVNIRTYNDWGLTTSTTSSKISCRTAQSYTVTKNAESMPIYLKRCNWGDHTSLQFGITHERKCILNAGQSNIYPMLITDSDMQGTPLTYTTGGEDGTGNRNTQTTTGNQNTQTTTGTDATDTGTTSPTGHGNGHGRVGMGERPYPNFDDLECERTDYAGCAAIYGEMKILKSYFGAQGWYGLYKDFGTLTGDEVEARKNVPVTIHYPPTSMSWGLRLEAPDDYPEGLVFNCDVQWFKNGSPMPIPKVMRDWSRFYDFCYIGKGANGSMNFSAGVHHYTLDDGLAFEDYPVPFGPGNYRVEMRIGFDKPDSSWQPFTERSFTIEDWDAETECNVPFDQMPSDAVELRALKTACKGVFGKGFKVNDNFNVDCTDYATCAEEYGPLIYSSSFEGYQFWSPMYTGLQDKKSQWFAGLFSPSAVLFKVKLEFKPKYDALTHHLPDGYVFPLTVKIMHAGSREEIGSTTCQWGNPEGPEEGIGNADDTCYEGVYPIGNGTAVEDSYGRWIPGDYIVEAWLDKTMLGSHAFRVYQVDYATDCWPGAGNTHIFQLPVLKQYKANIAALGMPLNENYMRAKFTARHLSNACYAYGNRNAD